MITKRRAFVAFVAPGLVLLLVVLGWNAYDRRAELLQRLRDSARM